MSGKTLHRALFVICALIAVLAVVGTVVTRYWISSAVRVETAKAKPAAAHLVDEQPLIAAQRLAALATPEEQELAQNILRLADHEVDLAFAAALHQATQHPPPMPAAARPILARVQSLQEKVKAEQKQVARLKEQLAKADDNNKVQLDDSLELTEATFEVDREDLDAARQELIRAGGDPQSKIQELLEQHESLGHDRTGAGAAGSAPKATPAAQEVETRFFVVQLRAWRQWAAKEKELAAALEYAKASEAQLAQEHQHLDEETKAAESRETEAGRAAPSSGAVPGQKPAGGSTHRDVYSSLKQAAAERKHLAELDKRTADFQQLCALYGQWETLVAERKNDHLKNAVEGAAWIVVLLLLVLLAGPLARATVARLAPSSTYRHTVRPVARVALQVSGVVLILLVLFGPPNQLATVLALAGAGLTVALKDFIVGFLGWFILMGPNGIRPGDWVQINGIGGEVVEVGLLHTVILETGDSSDAGHPTGRKVTFVNSFAIEGHYFNFSTAGQWLWDEIEVPVPAGMDPYPIAEAVHKSVAAETQANMRLAEQEWQRAVPGHVGRTFSPVPAIMVRPTTLGVNVIVRYITRANERHEQRSRLFHKIVELLRHGAAAAPPLENSSAASSAASAG
jgi:small-conductance mechanosensitive channel